MGFNTKINVFRIYVEGLTDSKRAGNEPSYSGSARARLEKSSAQAQLGS